MYWIMTMRVYATDVLPKGMNQALTNLYAQYYILVNGFIAFGLLTGVLAFIVLYVQLGAMGHQPYARMFILKEMVVVGITTALLGGFPLLIVLYYTMFS